MEVDDDFAEPHLPEQGSTTPLEYSSLPSTTSVMTLRFGADLYLFFVAPPHLPRDSFREIQVKVHIRRPERDSWVYLGRGTVIQEVTGQSSRVGESLAAMADRLR
jgi:hypothetical protein